MVCCLQSVFVDCLIEQTHQDIQAKEGTDVSYYKQLNNVTWNSMLRLLKYIITGSWCTWNYATQFLFEIGQSKVCNNKIINNNIIAWGFCDIQKSEGRGKCYLLRRRPKLITLRSWPWKFGISLKLDLIIG